MRNVSLEYCKTRKLEISKHVRCGLEGELKFQRSNVCCIVFEDAFDDLESRGFSTLPNHFNNVDRRRGIIFTLQQTMTVSSVLNRRYPCYTLL